MRSYYPILRNAENWLDNEFNDLFDTSWMPSMSFNFNRTAPAVNVKEDDKKYTMDIAAPGLKKEYARVELTNDGELHVAIENKMEHHEEDNKEEKKEHYLRREFSYGNYEQVFTLPEDVDRDNISAKVENGVLHITLPRTFDTSKDMKRIQVA